MPPSCWEDCNWPQCTALQLNTVLVWVHWLNPALQCYRCYWTVPRLHLTTDIQLYKHECFIYEVHNNQHCSHWCAELSHYRILVFNQSYQLSCTGVLPVTWWLHTQLQSNTSWNDDCAVTTRWLDTDVVRLTDGCSHYTLLVLEK